jgi:DNA-binding transcriptional ArsR family regulator
MADSASKFAVDRILPGIGSTVRWRVLKELAKGEPLPICELARRLRMSESAMSKQMAVMRRSGLAVNRYGCYKIPAGVLSADGKTADYGCIVLRLDR